MMNAHGQIFFHAIAARRTILRRESCGNFNQRFTGTFRLVFQLLKEVSDCNIVHLFAEYAFGHTQNRKFPNRNQILLINEIGRNFVLKIVSLVTNLLMNLFELQNRFPSLVTAFLSTGNTPLSNSQFLLRGFVVFEIVYLCSVAQSCKRRNSNVNSDNLTCFLKRLGFGFNGENRKPFSALPFNRQSFNFADYLTRKFEFNRSDFRERQLISRQRETALRKTKTVESVLTFETRKTCLTFFGAAVKSLETFVQSFQNVLQNLRVNLFIFGIGLLNFFELVGLIVIVQRNAIQLISIAAFLKRGVIQISAEIQSLFKIRLGNFRGFADAKLEGFLYDGISDFHYFRNDCLQGESVISVTCSPVFNYIKHSRFLQSRLLIYVKETIAEKGDC